MGAFFTNFQIQSKSKAKVATAAKQLIVARAYVSKVSQGWVGVYDERTENQQDGEITRIAKGLSEALHTVVFAFLVHDSDIFQYWLFDDGNLKDTFNSDPDYFTETTAEARALVAGNTKLLFSYCKKGADEAFLEQVLHPSAPEANNPKENPKPFVFAEQQLSAFAALFNIDGVRATLGFDALAEMESEDPGEIRQEFQRVTGTNYKTVFKQSQSLIEAVHSGNAQEVERLLSTGTNLTTHNDVGYTPLMIAFGKGNAGIVRLLLKAGADIRAKSFGSTIIAHAVGSGSPEIVQLAIESGADVFARDVMGRTALIVALCCNHPMFLEEIIDLLVKAGASVNQAADVQFSMHREFERGVTPLIYAARFGDVPATKKLLALGALPDTKDANGDDAKTYATNKLNRIRDVLKNGVKNTPEAQSATRFLNARMADLETIIELLSGQVPA